MLKRGLILAFGMLIMSGTAGVFADENTATDPKQVESKAWEFTEGTHYSLLEAPFQEGVAPVIEFFYYGCRACYQLVNDMGLWRRETGYQVSLVPAHSKNELVESARMFHTFAEMGVLAEMYELGYVIFQTKESELEGTDRINDFLLRHDVDQVQFWQTWGSEAVEKRLAYSAAMTVQAKVMKTPSFVVKGKYKVNIDSVKSVHELHALLTYLVEMPDKSVSTL